MNNELNRRAPAQPEPSNKNTGHGHVRPRPDGVRARCGGPGVCKECSREKAAMSQPEPAAPTEATLDQMANTAWDRFQSHTVVLQALENCRLYAARHRKEEWSAVIRRFCAEGGATGSPLREAAPAVVEPLNRDVVAEIVRNHLTATYHCTRVWGAWSVGTMTEDDFELASESDMAEEIADAILAATPPRAALTDEQIDKIIVAQWGTHPSVIFKAHRAFARAVITADRGQG